MATASVIIPNHNGGMNDKDSSRKTPQVSVIVVNFNTRELLCACLRSVEQISVSKEIFVVDNGSTDCSVEMVEKEFPQVILIRNSSNERFARPNNDAMRRAHGEYYFLLNSDAEIKPGSLEQLVRYLETHQDVGAVGPQLLNADGSLQPSAKGFVSLWTHLCDMLILDRLFPSSRLFASSEMTYFDHRSEREVDHLMAAAILLRSEAISQVGMFDEGLSIYYNDLDLSLRLRRAGWKIVFFPAAQAVHHSGRTAKPMIRRWGMFVEQYENIFYYYRKHFGEASVIVYKLLMLVGFSPRVIYWSVRSLGDRSENTSTRREFALWSFLVALPFCKKLSGASGRVAGPNEEPGDMIPRSTKET